MNVAKEEIKVITEDACGLPSNQPRFLFIKITGGEEAVPTRGLGRPVCKLQISTTVEEQSLPKNGLSQLPTAFIPGQRVTPGHPPWSRDPVRMSHRDSAIRPGAAQDVSLWSVLPRRKGSLCLACTAQLDVTGLCGLTRQEQLAVLWSALEPSPGQEKSPNSSDLCQNLQCLSSQSHEASAPGVCAGELWSCPCCGMLDLPLWTCAELSLQESVRPRWL
ncbi:uncharacterized protein GJ701_006151 isoform 2-T2 [Geothlypis trichas]